MELVKKKFRGFQKKMSIKSKIENKSIFKKYIQNDINKFL